MGSKAAEVVSAGSLPHLAMYRHVFSAPRAQALLCIPADKASIFSPLPTALNQEHQLTSSSPDLHLAQLSDIYSH